MRNIGLVRMILFVSILGLSCIPTPKMYAGVEQSFDTVIEIQCEQIRVLLETDEKLEINQKILIGRELRNFERLRIFYQSANLSGESCIADPQQGGYFLVIQKYAQSMGNEISFEQNLDIEKFFVKSSFNIYPSLENRDKLCLEASHMDLLTKEFEQLRIYNLEDHRILRKTCYPEEDILSADIEGCREVSNTSSSFCFSFAQVYVEDIFYDRFNINIDQFANLSLKNAHLIFSDSDEIEITSLNINENNIVGTIGSKVRWDNNEHREFEISVSDAKINIERFQTINNEDKLRIKVSGKVTEELVPVIGLEKEYRKQEEDGEFPEEFSKIINSKEDATFFEYDIVQIRIRLTNNIDKYLDIHIIDEQEDCGEIIGSTNNWYFDEVGPDKKEELRYKYKVKAYSQEELFTNNKIIVYYRIAGVDDSFKKVTINTANTTIRQNKIRAELEKRGYTQGQLDLFYIQTWLTIYSTLLIPLAAYMLYNKKYIWLFVLGFSMFWPLTLTRLPFEWRYKWLLMLLLLVWLLLFAAVLYLNRKKALQIYQIIRRKEKK